MPRRPLPLRWLPAACQAADLPAAPDKRAAVKQLVQSINRLLDEDAHGQARVENLPAVPPRRTKAG